MRKVRSSQWNALDKEEQLLFKRAAPEALKELDPSDIHKYEPQATGEVSGNFALLVLAPVEVEHVMIPPPQVIADARQPQFESITQPAKKHKRFRHSVKL